MLEMMYGSMRSGTLMKPGDQGDSALFPLESSFAKSRLSLCNKLEIHAKAADRAFFPSVDSFDGTIALVGKLAILSAIFILLGNNLNLVSG